MTHFGSLNAQFFGLTVDAFTTGTLGVNSVVERAIAIQGDTGLTAALGIDIFNAPFAFGELLVLAGGSCLLRKKQGATKALRTIAVGMIEPEGRMHAQADGTQWHAISVAFVDRMAMLVERHGGDAAQAKRVLMNVPRIKGRISCEIGGELIERNDGLLVEGAIIRDIVLVERLGLFGQDDIPIVRGGGCCHSRAVAPHVLFFLGGGAIGLLLVAAAFDAELAVGIACQSLVFVIAVFDVDALIVFLHPGVDMLDIEGHRFAQSRDLFL